MEVALVFPRGEGPDPEDKGFTEQLEGQERGLEALTPRAHLTAAWVPASSAGAFWSFLLPLSR